MSKYCSSQT